MSVVKVQSHGEGFACPGERYVSRRALRVLILPYIPLTLYFSDV